MLRGLTWEEETHARIERSKAEQSKAKAVYQHWTDRVEALERALQLERDGLNGSGQQKNLASMSVNSALMEIAKEHGGLVVTRDAISILTKAGIFSTRGEANDTIHSTLKRSRNFLKDRKGVYRLVSPTAQISQGKPALAAVQQKVGEVIQQLVNEHPTWGHKELVKAVVATGHDFEGKNPGLSVNMAIQRQKVRPKQSNPKSLYQARLEEVQGEVAG